ncbi:hypothetical protein TRFO_14437 [Tritrichomonas foetus]|uniref:Uncharacterized protein n=1 Tax=Tritrichomonas foetus TaxID=1144522 RepID=A0A1J4KZH5_9EUKA|nr:hypothetical protein TRFO_14437 [Tritrichomonas foetus]|eukprot:OHT15092.1 hypothetical protein TRFO_14437 [Tritrichomonas foetus]
MNTNIKVIFAYKDSRGIEQKKIVSADAFDCFHQVLQQSGILDDLPQFTTSNTSAANNYNPANLCGDQNPNISTEQLTCAGKEYLVIFNGKIVNEMQSLSGAGVKNGSRVIIYQKLPKTTHKRRIDRLQEIQNEHIKALKMRENLKQQKVKEILRINDQIWSTWESSRAHNQVMKFMKQKIHQNSKITDNFEIQKIQIFDTPSDTTMAKEICCKPLPNCFLNLPMSQKAVFMAEYPPSDCETKSTAQECDCE